MLSYENQICPCCKKPFLPTDDIVVCPDCGTPHHRACWNALGHCAMQEQHAAGYTAPPAYTEPEQPAASAAETAPGANDSLPDGSAKYCIRCGFRNRSDAAFCNHCGAPLPGERPQRNPYNPYTTFSEPFTQHFDANAAPDNQEADYDGVPAGDLDKLVGKNSFYYLFTFRRICDLHTIGRFNFCAFLFGGFWMFYRKQQKSGILCLIAQFALLAAFFISNLYLAYPLLTQIYNAAGIDLTGSAVAISQEQYMAVYQALLSLTSGQIFQIYLPFGFLLLSLVLQIVIGCNANRWYYRSLLAKSRQTRAQYPNDEGGCNSEFMRIGGTSLGMGLLSAALFYTLYFFMQMTLPML